MQNHAANLADNFNIFQHKVMDPLLHRPGSPIQFSGNRHQP
jgi:hypothetical protein